MRGIGGGLQKWYRANARNTAVNAGSRAKKMGVTPAELQEKTWVGGGDETGTVGQWSQK